MNLLDYLDAPPASASGNDISDLVAQKAEQYGVPAALALAVVNQESGARSGKISPKGAIGPMQLMPATAKGLGVDPHNDEQNIDGGVRYLKQLLDEFGDAKLAAAAYHAGPGAVHKAGGMPDTNDGLIKTSAYADSIMARARKLGLDDGAAPTMKKTTLDWLDDGSVPAAAGDQTNSLDSSLDAAYKAVGEPQGFLARSATSFAKGSGSLVKGIGWLIGSDTVQSLGENAEKYWSDLQARDPETARQLQAVENSKGFWNALVSLKDNPRGLADFIVSSIPSMIPGMGGSAVIGEAAGKIAFNSALKAGAARGLAEEAAHLAATKAAEKAAVMAGAAANMSSEGITQGGMSGADTEKFLLEHGASPEDAKRVAREAALKVGAATTLLAGIGAGFETKAALGKLPEKGVVGFAHNVGKEAAEEGLQNPAQDYFETQAKQTVDPSQQFDLGKSVALGVATGGLMGAGVHASGRAATMLAGEPEAHVTPSPDKPTNEEHAVSFNAALDAVSKAGSVDEAISAATAAASVPVNLDLGQSVDQLSKEQQIRSVIGGDSMRDWMSSLDPLTRQEVLGAANVAMTQGASSTLRGNAIDQLHQQLSDGGVFAAHEQAKTATAVPEGTKVPATPTAAEQFLRSREMIAELTKSPEWQDLLSKVDTDTRSNILDTLASISNPRLPAGYRNTLAGTVIDFARNAGVYTGPRQLPAPNTAMMADSSGNVGTSGAFDLHAEADRRAQLAAERERQAMGLSDRGVQAAIARNTQPTETVPAQAPALEMRQMPRLPAPDPRIFVDQSGNAGSQAAVQTAKIIAQEERQSEAQRRANDGLTDRGVQAAIARSEKDRAWREKTAKDYYRTKIHSPKLINEVLRADTPEAAAAVVREMAAAKRGSPKLLDALHASLTGKTVQEYQATPITPAVEAQPVAVENTIPDRAVTEAPEKRSKPAPNKAERVVAETKPGPVQEQDRLGREVERYTGMYKKGMTEFNARMEAKRRNHAQDQVVWMVENAEDKFGADRYVIVGYEQAKEKARVSPPEKSGNPSFAGESPDAGKAASIAENRSSDEASAESGDADGMPGEKGEKAKFFQQGNFPQPEPFKTKTDANMFRARNKVDGVAVEKDGGWLFDPTPRALTAEEKAEAATDVKELNRVLRAQGVKTVIPLSSIPTANHALAKQLGKIFGAKVQFVSNNPGFEGVAYKGVAYLTENLKRPELAIAGHEVFHTLEQTAPKMAEQLLEHVRGYLQENVISDRKIREELVSGGEVSERYAAGEVLADLNGAMWLDPKFWREMRARDENLFRQVAYRFMEAMTKAIKSLTGTRFDVTALVTDVDAVRSLIAQTWTEHLRGNEGQASDSLSMSRSANFIKELSRHDELFRLPKSDKTTLEGIVADNDPRIKVRRFASIPGELARYTFQFPDGTTARMVERQAGSVYGFEAADGEMRVTDDRLPGANPEAAEGKDEVFIDVSLLNPAHGFGAVMYNIASTYAHNTGKVFIGDPAGLSDEAMFRRPQQMLSSALKFGTTEHLAPHPRQLTGDKSLGIPGLKWAHGDDDANVRSLIDVTLKSIDNNGGNGDISYNTSTGKFVDSHGNELSRDDISRMAGVGLGRSSQAGGATLARHALLKSLVQGEGGQVRGSDGILASLMEQLRQSHPTDRNDPLHDIFYSRKNDAELKSSTSEQADTAARDNTDAHQDSRGARVSRTQENTPEFKRWFGDSKVVDENGKPLVVYHGTVGDFNAFSKAKLGETTGAASAKSAFFFTNHEDTAADYTEIGDGRTAKDLMKAYERLEKIAQRTGKNSDWDRYYDAYQAYEDHVLSDDHSIGNEGANVVPVYLSIKNPLIKDFEGKEYREETYYDLIQKAKREGHDGVIFKDTVDPGNPNSSDVITVYGAFEPTQIKSSTGNRGTFDPENPDIRFSRLALGELTDDQAAAAERVLGKPKTLKERAQELRQNIGKNLVQGIFDQFAPIKSIDEKAYVLSRMSKGGDSTLEAMMIYGKPFVDADGFYDVDYSQAKGKAGFATIMAPLQGEQDRFFLWVAAQRAERLKAIGLENLFSDKDIQALKTLADGKMETGASRKEAYAKALMGMNEFNDAVLKIAADSGLIDEETRKMYKDTPYVPFYRLQEEGVTGFGMKAGLVNQTAWKKLKGGTEKLNEDLLANTLQNWSHLITAAAKNRAAKATLEAAVRAGIAEEVPNGTPGKGLVSFRDGGKDRTFIVSDPYVMDAVSALEYAGLGPWAKPLTKMKHMLTIGVTANPAFKIRNLLRDSIQAIGTADLSYNPLENMKSGWLASAEDSETRAKMLASGGMIRFGSMLDGATADRARSMIHKFADGDVTLKDENAVKKFWRKTVQPALDVYQELGDRGEQVNRAALYEQLRAKGMSHGEASFWARDLMDFSGSGKWQAIRFLTQVVPFMNARLQGLYKLGRAGMDDYKRFAAVTGAVALASIGLMLAYVDDDDWKKREDWDRQNYWWFKIGDTAFRIPKPFELGAVGTIAEMGVQMFADDEMDGKRFLANLGDIIGNQLSMNPIPQMAKPLLDVYANTDSFTKRPIENMAMQRLRPEDRYNDRTSEVGRLLGSLGLPDPVMLMMGHYEALSPVKIDALTRGYFSWIGTMTTTALDYGIRPMLDRGERPAMQLKDAFLVGNFAESLPTNSSRYVSQMYEQAKEIEQAYASYHQAVKDGDHAKAQEIMESHRDELARYKSMESVKRKESEINARINKIEANQAMPAETKRRLLDLLAAQRDQIARQISVRG